MPKKQVGGRTVHLPYPSKGIGAAKEVRNKAVKRALKKKK